jgi:hypothetical protein
LDIVESFLNSSKGGFKRMADRARAELVLMRWAAAWQSPSRSLTQTNSNHGPYLQFNQFIAGMWCKVFAFHISSRQGLTLRGPDTDRARKSHKLRGNRLDPKPLDDLFGAWSMHPEARPAGNAVELLLSEAHDDVWESLLQEALSCLNE